MMNVTVSFYFGEGTELIAEMCCPPRVGEYVQLPDGREGVVWRVSWQLSRFKAGVRKFAGVYLRDESASRDDFVDE